MWNQTRDVVKLTPQASSRHCDSSSPRWNLAVPNSTPSTTQTRSIGPLFVPDRVQQEQASKPMTLATNGCQPAIAPTSKNSGFILPVSNSPDSSFNSSGCERLTLLPDVSPRSLGEANQPAPKRVADSQQEKRIRPWAKLISLAICK